MTHFAMIQKMIIEQSTQRCCFHIKPSLRLVLTTLPLQPLRVLSSRARRRPDISASNDLATGILRSPFFSQASEKAYEEDRFQRSESRRLKSILYLRALPELAKWLGSIFSFSCVPSPMARKFFYRWAISSSYSIQRHHFELFVT